MFSSMCHRCGCAFECASSGTVARSVGRTQAHSRHATECVVNLSFSNFSRHAMAAVGFWFLGRCERSSTPRGLSNRRFCDEHQRKVAWSRQGTLFQFDCVAVFQTSEKLLVSTAERNRILRLQTKTSGQHVSLCQRCTVLCCSGGTLDEAIRPVGGMLITDSR